MCALIVSYNRSIRGVIANWRRKDKLILWQFCIQNIRKYLGINAGNKAIHDTLIDDIKCSNFFFYNNGITMICSDFQYNALKKGDWKVQVQGMQIINGGQSCKTIHQMRLYAVGTDESAIEGITRVTNRQHPVDFRDLKSNDEIQRLLEMIVLLKKYYGPVMNSTGSRSAASGSAADH
ncbi:MAG: AIPR family protein [Treponema sp.]|nr:AIPR family protein [Treponema sp.]